MPNLKINNLQGDLPKHWFETTLKEVVSKIVDGSHNPPAKQSAGLPMLSARNIANNKISFENYRFITKSDFDREAERTKMSPGDVLLTIVGTIGRSAIVSSGTKAFTLQRSVAVLTPVGIYQKFLMYFFQSPFGQEYFNKNAKGTAQKGLYLKILGRMPIRVAPLNEQTRIVAEIEKQFSRLDEAVENLNRVKANLKRYKAAILKAAVEGRLTEEWRKAHPDGEPAVKLRDRILSERRKKWEESELAKMKAKGNVPKDDKWKKKYKEPIKPNLKNISIIPDNWQWLASDQLFWFVTSGSRGWANYYSDEGPIFLRIGNLNHDSIDLDLTKLQHVSPPEGAEGIRTQVESGDILISITADIGTIAIIPEQFEKAYINQHISLARSVSIINAKYLAWFLASPAGQKQLKDLQRGATKIGLGLDDIKSINVPLPSSEEQNEIVSEIDRHLTIIDRLDLVISKNVKRSEKFKQSILKKAFSGQLVAQNPNDEPASELLKRIKEEKEREGIEQALKRKTKQTARKKVMPKKKKEIMPLPRVLNESKKMLTPEELLEKAGYTIETIDEFYEALKNEIDGAKTIEEVRPDNIQIFLRLAS